MVDTVTCLSEADLTEKFFEKLLLGAIDKAVDQEVIETPSDATNSHSNQPQHYTPPPTTQQSTFSQSNYEKFAPQHAKYGNDISAERYPKTQVTSFYNLPAAQSSPSMSQITPRYSAQTEQPVQEPAISLLRQSTLPQTSAELPVQPAARSRTFGRARLGWKPVS